MAGWSSLAGWISYPAGLAAHNAASACQAIAWISASFGRIWSLRVSTAISDELQTFSCQMGHLGPMWLSTVRDGQGGRIGPSNGSAPLTPLVLDAFWPPVPGGAQSSMLGRCEAVTLLAGGLFRRFLARSKAERPEKRILPILSTIG